MNSNDRFLQDVDPRRIAFARGIDPDKVEAEAQLAYQDPGYVACPMMFSSFDVVWKILLPAELFSPRSQRLAFGERIHDTPPITMMEDVAKDLAHALNTARRERTSGG